jgi:hypothetical protein
MILYEYVVAELNRHEIPHGDIPGKGKILAADTLVLKYSFYSVIQTRLQQI